MKQLIKEEIHSIIQKRIRDMLLGKQFSGLPSYAMLETEIVNWKVIDISFLPAFVHIQTDYGSPMWWEYKVRDKIKKYYNLDCGFTSKHQHYSRSEDQRGQIPLNENVDTKLLDHIRKKYIGKKYRLHITVYTIKKIDIYLTDVVYIGITSDNYNVPENSNAYKTLASLRDELKIRYDLKVGFDYLEYK